MNNRLKDVFINCSASIQNILLVSSMLGLGACWIGVYPVEERIFPIKSYFNLPEHIVPVAIISLGYPKKQLEVRTQFTREKIHINSWY